MIAATNVVSASSIRDASSHVVSYCAFRDEAQEMMIRSARGKTIGVFTAESSDCGVGEEQHIEEYEAGNENVDEEMIIHPPRLSMAAPLYLHLSFNPLFPIP
jgi:hypothetical protein